MSVTTSNEGFLPRSETVVAAQPVRCQPSVDLHSLKKKLASYDTPTFVRGFSELAVTALPMIALWVAAWVAFQFGHLWLTVLLALANAGFLVRLFMIQHDCGHGTFVPGSAINNAIGRVLSVLTWTPYDLWRHSHAMHHASSGNLDRRGLGDVDTLTVREYHSRSRLARWRYRLYRHPLVLFGIGPAYLFLLQNRLPFGFMRSGLKSWVSTMATNLGIIAFLAILWWLVGLKALLLIHAPTVLLAAAAGVWLFYVQHQFEQTSWQNQLAWDRHEAALFGSSYYELPGVLRWFTANIGIHHVHHLRSRIPFYRLPQVLRDHPNLRAISRVTVLDSVRAVKLALWDENRERLISFKEAARHRLQTTSPAS